MKMDELPTNDARIASVWISTLNAVAGIWLLFAPFVVFYSNGKALINDVVLGIVIAVFAVLRAFFPGSWTAWLSWLNALCAVWLLVAPFVLGYARGPRANDIVVGIVVFILSIWSAVASAKRLTIPVGR